MTGKNRPQQASGPSADDALLPPAATHDGSRGAILRESLILFAERGYGATTVRDIAARVGMLSGSLYSHFSSKEMILAELVRAGMAEHHQRFRDAVLASAPDPVSQLSALVREHARFHIQYSMLAIVANGELHVLSPELAKESLDLRNQSVRLLRDIVQRGITLGVFDVPDLEIVITAIGGLGLRVAYWYTPSFHLDAAQVADHIAELARRLVGAERPAQQHP